MLYLATTCPSEELNSGLWGLSSACLAGAAILAFVALFLLIFEKAGMRRCALASGCLSLFPFCFAAYVHKIDFVVVAYDGTPASGPLWKAVLIPGILLLASALLIYLRRLFPVERD